MSLRIRSLSVAGFRAYGVDEQVLNLPSDLAAVWGPNSKGKTSLAEALEFLLAGEISRRELMASAQDEFARHFGTFICRLVTRSMFRPGLR